MRALLENPLWQKARAERARQRLLGRVSGILLAIALLGLFDGLLAQMRAGSRALDLIAGESATVSGPSALKNPIASDLVARFAPEGAPLRFELEGFFTGYWFGSGMWRGKITALPDAGPGRYYLRIVFRGASAQSAQEYSLNVFENAAAMRAASLSWIRRIADINPFILASLCGLLGICFGAATYLHGRRLALILRQLGISEIYARNDRAGEIICLAPKDMAPPPDNCRMLLAPDGAVCGEARAISWQKGKLKMKLLDGANVPAGAMVCLRHPGGDDNIHHQGLA